MKIDFNQQKRINFNAQLLSQWKCKNSSGRTKNITIAMLQKEDFNYIDKFSQNLQIYNHLDSTRQEIMKSTIKTIKVLLKDFNDSYKKLKILLAVQEGKPCGILVANIPKESIITDTPVYSSRHNPAKNETEIDWLVTWNPRKNEKIKGIGKALVGEYYRTLKTDKFRDVYVRSEIPEFSQAQYFYESLGFEEIGTKRKKIITKNSSLCIADKFSNSNEDVIPMIVTASKYKSKFQELSKKMCRREFVKNSVDIESLVEKT